jgi:tetratricopeptide (TPR) repeat protein
MRVEAFREKLLWNVPTAMKTYEEILQRWPDDHDALAEMSRAKWWFWYWSEGLEYAQRGLALYPDDLFFLEMVSGGLVVTGRSEESLPVARRRIAIDNSYDAWDNLSYAFLTLGELDSAMVAQEEGMRVDPNPLAFEEAKVQIASATGDLERTIELVEARAENSALSPRKRYSARVNEHNGVMGYYLLAGRYRDAMALLQEANRRETDVDGVRRDVNMCNLLSLLGRHEEALAYITRCRLTDTWTRDPNSSKYDRPDGEINSLIALGRFDEVRVLLNGKTEAVLPGPHQFRMARLALAEQHPEQALEHLERAVQYGVIWGWMDIDYHVMRAEAFQQARRPEDAEVELREVIRKYPIYKVAHYHLARILDERGAAQDAATEYRTFLEAWPRADQDLTEVVTARERLVALVDGR